MTPSPPHLRFERKFIAPHVSHDQTAAFVQRHPALFREIYPPRFVNNIYLDSPQFSAYFDHVNGLPNRLKTRIRWYGPLVGPVEKPILERKIKRGFVSGKIAFPLPALTVNGHAVRSELEPILQNSPLPPLLQSALRHLSPVLINRYQRRYFLSADGQFRLTIDFALEFFDPRPNAPIVPARPPQRHVIIELKFDPRHAETAPHLTNAIPFRLTRCSKYVLGIQHLHPA